MFNLFRNLRRFSSTPRNLGLEEFFDNSKGWVWEEQALKTGRAWMSSELRNKSFDDLHSLWWVCIKEMNKLLSQQQEARRFKVFFTQDTRKHQVKLTMARIKQVLWERRSNWMEANGIYKSVKNNEIPESLPERGRRKKSTSWTIV
ncbi:39S ribosomal protein L47, mitochondrial [Terramyces sp. JEL0728]|nr:39S ribosomal protein L47, mitochondrial [Terramyces sp. JEL0728]